MVRLLEKPWRDVRLLHRPRREPPCANQSLGPIPTQEIHRPRGVSRIRCGEVADHRSHFRVRLRRLIELGEEARELLHGAPSAPESPASSEFPVPGSAESSSTSPSSNSPFHPLATARASTPCSVSQRASCSRYPCVTNTRSAPVAAMAPSSAGQST